MTVRALTLSALLGALVVPGGPAGAATACDPSQEPPPGPVELCGTTTVTGARSATSRVTVPKMTWVRESSVTFAEPGRYGGILLVEDVPERNGNMLLVASAPRNALCDETGCPPPPVHVQSFDGREWSGVGQGGDVLAAGTYVLHLIADGVPTSVTLHLHGLSGAVEVTPASPAEIEIDTLGSPIPENAAFADGSFRDRERTGIYVAAHWEVFDPNFVWLPWTCEYDREPPAYSPGCPGARAFYGSGGGWVGIHGNTVSRVAGLHVGTPGTGPLGVGQWILMSGRPTRIGAVNIWITFS